MPVNSVNGNYAYNGYSVIKEQQKASKEEAAAATEKTEEAVVADKAKKNEDSYVKSTDKKETNTNTDTYRPSAEKVAEAKVDRTRNVSAFKAMAEALFKSQADKTGSSSKLKDILKDITGKDVNNEDTSFDDDPTWGVEAVATRILDFAKSLAGGDDSKIDMLRNAVEKGFKEAEKAWGGQLPGISQRTYDKIMQGFDEWKNPSKTVEE